MAAPPPGVTPNLENPLSRAHNVIIVNAVFLTFATFFVMLRVYTRAFISRAWGSDDCTLVFEGPFCSGLLLIHLQMCVCLQW